VSIEHLLNATVDMKRPTPDYDGMGNVNYTLSTFSSDHACRISQSMPVDVTSGPTEWSEANAMVYVMSGTEFKRDDEVHHGSEVYTVIGIKTPSVNDHHTSLVCKVNTNEQ